jgi:hypothetical protein
VLIRPSTISFLRIPVGGDTGGVVAGAAATGGVVVGAGALEASAQISAAAVSAWRTRREEGDIAEMLPQKVGTSRYQLAT